MQIDWITVGAQIVNFLVLVWLLQRFLYGPIVRAMDRRERRIAERLDEAELGKREAAAEAQSYREKQERLEQQRGELLTQARASAEEEKKVLEMALRREIDRQRQEWSRQFEAQRNQFLEEVRERAASHFYGMARKVLNDLADARLEDQIAAVFINHIGGLDGATRRKIGAACKTAGNTVTVHTRFALRTVRRREITAAIHDFIAGDAKVAFEDGGSANSGIELQAGSQKIVWNLDSYLDDLQQAVGEELSAMSSSSAEPVAS